MWTHYTRDEKILSDTIAHYMHSEDKNVKELTNILKKFLKGIDLIFKNGSLLILKERKKALDKLIEFNEGLDEDSDAANLTTHCIPLAKNFYSYLKDRAENFDTYKGQPIEYYYDGFA